MGLGLIGSFLLFVLILKLWWIKKRNIRKQGLKRYLDKIKTNDKNKDKPNIIIIFMDDMGYADISCFGAKTIQTPHIDRLAKEGVTFTNFYASAPVCSPSRAGLLTGRYPVRAHVPTVFIPSGTLASHVFGAVTYSYGMKGISPDEIILPEVLKANGYATGILGKWHLGDKKPFLPNDKGFDFFYGAYFSNDMSPYEIYRNEELEIPVPVDQEVLTKSFTREAINFINNHKDEPFFLYYAQPFPHDPLHASDEFKGTSKAGIYGDTVQEIDWSVGKILERLEELNLTENTLILLSSDNGPIHEGNPGYARGRKGLTFDGGQRVPFIAKWPRKIPASTSTDIPCMNIDIFPTILDMLDLPLPDDRIIDGISLNKLFQTPNSQTPLNRALYFFWNKNIQAVRFNEWKYHIKHRSDVSTFVLLKPPPKLFHLVSDPNESYDQTTHHPEEASQLKKMIETMSKDLKANLRGWKKN